MRATTTILSFALGILLAPMHALPCELTDIAALAPSSQNYRAGETLRFNTSNAKKQTELTRLLNAKGLNVVFTALDLKEIDADPMSVIAQKASQFPDNAPSVVEDASLDVEGEQVGVNVRWLLDTLPQHLGKRATFRVLVGVRADGKVKVYAGEVRGTIVAARGQGFGFDPHFLPDGATQTLAEAKPDPLNARALAIEQLINGHPFATVDPIDDWTGPWQTDH